MNRQLGLFQTVALGIGGTIGGGIFTLVGVAAGQAGRAALISFMLAFMVAVLLGLCYAELASRMPRAGGAYAFVREAFGSHAGFLMGWGYWGGYLVASGYVTLGFGGYLEEITGLPRVPSAVGLVGVLVVINLMGVRLSGRLQAVVVSLEVAVLMWLAVYGSWRAGPQALETFLPTKWPGVVAASLAAFLAFGGFDQVAALAEEVVEPRRTLPIAIVLSPLAVLVLYVGLLYACVGSASPEELAGSHAPLALAAARFLGPRAAVIVPMTALLTTAATTNALILVTSRVLYAMARDGLALRSLGLLRGPENVPAAAILVSGAGMMLVALLGNIQYVVRAAGFLYTLGFVLSLAAYFRMRRRNGPAPFALPGYPVVPIAALALTILILVQAGSSGAAAGLAWFAIGEAVYRLQTS